MVVKTELLWVSKAIVQAANDGNQVINISVGSYIILDKNDHQTFRKDEKVEYDALQKAINYAKKKNLSLLLQLVMMVLMSMTNRN